MNSSKPKSKKNRKTCSIPISCDRTFSRIHNRNPTIPSFSLRMISKLKSSSPHPLSPKPKRKRNQPANSAKGIGPNANSRNMTQAKKTTINNRNNSNKNSQYSKAMKYSKMKTTRRQKVSSRGRKKSEQGRKRKEQGRRKRRKGCKLRKWRKWSAKRQPPPLITMCWCTPY